MPLVPCREQLLLRVILVIASGLFLAGLWLPIATIEQFFIFDNTISVLSGLWELALGNQVLLFVLILSFSVVLPLLKMMILWRILFSRALAGARVNRWIRLMHRYGRWSMLDVFVVAMLVVGVKLTAIADIETHIGLYLFAAGILLNMAVTARVARGY
ncbi:MAG: paraquat-inducible protein A [Porticoccaceae bacterium]|nr:paraquat-inducible protein A [Porticoccaceae bacterium]